MHRYRVVQCQAAEGRLQLQCSAGRYHLTRALGQLPAVGTILVGTKPHLGFCVLLGPNQGEVFRMIFESIDREGVADRPTWTHAPDRQAQRADREVSQSDD